MTLMVATGHSAAASTACGSGDYYGTHSAYKSWTSVTDIEVTCNSLYTRAKTNPPSAGESWYPRKYSFDTQTVCWTKCAYAPLSYVTDHQSGT